MKISLFLIACGFLTQSAFAEFETWTSKDGKTVELELVSVTKKDGENIGEFKMRNGKSVSIKASGLGDPDAKKLADFKPAVASAVSPNAAPVSKSTFDSFLDGNLLKLAGKKVGRASDLAKPSKYYVFYYSASWCQPCQKFTPSFVEFYNKNKNEGFEVYLISSDSEEADMEGYIKDKNMPWPALKLGKTEKFKKEINHEVPGIPFIAVTKADGTVVDKGNAYVMLPKLDKLLAK